MPAPGKQPSRRKRNYDHAIHTLLIDRYGEIIGKRHAEKNLEFIQPFTLTSPDYEIFVAATAYITLFSHLTKLDQCVYYIKTTGRNGYYKEADVHFHQADWQEYHLGYFYTLLKSANDSTLWFIHQAFHLSIPPKYKFEETLLKEIDGMDKLITALKGLRAHCDKGGRHRNDHVHRGAAIKAEPLTKLRTVDDAKNTLSVYELLTRFNDDRKWKDGRKIAERQFREERRSLIRSLQNDINKLHELLTPVLDEVETALRGWLEKFKK